MAWSAITSRSASFALARDSCRQRSIDSAEAWLITPDRAVAPGVKPADSGVSTGSRSFARGGGALMMSVSPNRKRGPAVTAMTIGTSCGNCTASVTSETSCPAARMLIVGP